MSPVRNSSLGRVSVEVRRAACFALLIAAIVQLPMVLVAVRGADAAEPGSLLETIASATQLPGLLLTAKKETPAPAPEPFLDPVVVEKARSVVPPGLTPAAINTLVMALVAYVALRTLFAIWPRRIEPRPARHSAR